jgi:hypothetical protein
MATLSIRLNGNPDILNNLLINELESLINQLDEDASVSISIEENSSKITFTGVEENKRNEIILKADEVIRTYRLNQ